MNIQSAMELTMASATAGLVIQFGSWEGLSPSSLAQVLRATEKGLSGINPERNRQGDPVYVYGSSLYEQKGNGWQSVGFTTAGVSPAPDAGDAAPPSRAQQLIRQLASMVDLPPPGVDPVQERVISEELDRALRTIGRRVERQKKVLTVAGGPGGGEYGRIAEAVTRTVGQALPRQKVRALETDGSVENAWLLDRGEADFALMQSDTAALAAAGEGAFAGEEGRADGLHCRHGTMSTWARSSGSGRPEEGGHHRGLDDSRRPDPLRGWWSPGPAWPGQLRRFDGESVFEVTKR
jgi:hypothetical protein